MSSVTEPARLRLAQLPTPLEPYDLPGNTPTLWVKRDDLTGTGLTGNKVRKLEYLLADEGPGDGGFAVIAGSRACSAALLLPPAAALTNSSSADKANLPMPRTLSLMEDHTPAVTEVCGKAGDAVSRRRQVFSAQDC